MRRRPLQLCDKCMAEYAVIMVHSFGILNLWDIIKKMCSAIVHCYVTCIKLNVECGAKTSFFFIFLLVDKMINIRRYTLGSCIV